MIRRSYLFSGRVQHVGFRWRARKTAVRFGCTGWCRNNPDGTVSMEIQGTEARINLVIAAIRCGRYIHVEHMEFSTLPAVPDEKEFISKY